MNDPAKDTQTRPIVSERKAICCHCTTRCGVLVRINEADLPVAVCGDPSHPVSKGVICPRSRAAIEYYNHPTRINHPSRRIGSRGEGRWEVISWKEAVSDIAQRLRQLKDQHGAETVAYLPGTFHGPDQGSGIRFMNLFGSPNYGGAGPICEGPQLVAETLVYGFGPAKPDLRPEETEAIVLWSLRPSSSNPPGWGRIREAQRAGAKLIVVVPYRTLEARSAGTWPQVKPNTDAALALGVINALIVRGLYDRKFIEANTIGFGELSQRAAQYDVDYVLETCGLGLNAFEAIVAALAGKGPCSLYSNVANGMGRNVFSYELAKSLLIVISGNLNRRGANVLEGPPARALSKVDFELYDEMPMLQRQKRIGGDRYPLHVQGYDLIAEAQRKVWPGRRRLLTASYGATGHPPSTFRAAINQCPYPVTALIVQHNNAVGCYPNSRLARDAMTSENLKLSVVQDIFLTATATLAGYATPASSWLERPFLYMSGQDPLVIPTQRTVEPSHDRHSDYDFFRDLGRELSRSEYWPETLEDAWSSFLEPAGLSFQELYSREKNWFRDTRDGAAGGQQGFATGSSEVFGTPSGKVELAPSILKTIGADPLPKFSELKPTDDEFPFVLTTGSTSIHTTHQDHRQIHELRRRHPDPIAKVHPTVAASKGIANGDWIYVQTAHGAIRQRAELTKDIRPEIIDAERWWYPEGSGKLPGLFGVFETNVNSITDDDPDLCDEIYGAWPMRVARCRVSKADN